MIKLEKGHYLKLLKEVEIYDPNTLEPVTIPKGSHGEVTYVGLCVFVNQNHSPETFLAVKFKEGSMVMFGFDLQENFNATFEVL